MKVNIFIQKVILEYFDFMKEILKQSKISRISEFLLLDMYNDPLHQIQNHKTRAFFVLKNNMVKNTALLEETKDVKYLIHIPEPGHIHMYRNNTNLEDGYDIARKELMKLVKSLEGVN